MVDAIGTGPAFQAFSRPAGPSVDNPSLNDRNATSNGAPVDGPSPSLGGQPPVGLDQQLSLQDVTARGSLVDFAT